MGVWRPIALLLITTLVLTNLGNIPNHSLSGKPYNIYWINDLMLVLPKGFEIINYYPLNIRDTAKGLNSLRFSDLYSFLSKFKVSYDVPNYMKVLGKYIPLTTMYDVVNFLNISNVTSLIGVEGEDVVVGIIDTGVDFASPSLGLDAVARDEYGRPLTLDADELGLVITPLEVEVSNGELQTAGKSVWVYVPFYGLVEVKMYQNVGAPSVVSKSGKYRFGLAVVYFPLSNYLLDFDGLNIGLGIPLVLVDSSAEGFYDTVVADLSTAWFLLNALLYGFGVLASPPPPYFFDLSLADEVVARPGNELIARDFTGDGVYDISIGIISGYVYDALGILKAIELATELSDWSKAWEFVGSGIYVGLDPKGKYVDILYDPFGHGTAVANIIVGEAFNYTIKSTYGVFNYTHRGIAPKAKLAVATALYLGDVVVSMLWLSGHDYQYPWRWSYTGKPRVDIISNSWGVVLWDSILIFGDKYFPPGYDPITAFEEYVAELGVIVIHAAGNSGPSTSTILPPAIAPSVISVGATTVFVKPIVNFRGEVVIREGRSNVVISWSSRGPHPLNVKPDVVAPGAYAVAPTVVTCGLGDGTRAIDTFGGTSMATPIVAGIAALLMSYAKKIGLDKDLIPSLVRNAILYGAKPLNFNTFSEGWGLVELNSSVRLIESFTSLPRLINHEELKTGKLFEINNLAFSGKYVSNVIRVKHGEVTKVGFVEVGKVSSYELLTLVKDKTTYLGSTIAKPRDYTYIIVDRKELKGDYVEFLITYPLSDLDPYLIKGKYEPKRLIMPVIYDWIDRNNDSVVDGDEIYLVNHGISGSSTEVIGINPSVIKGKPVIAVKSLGNYTVMVKAYITNYVRSKSTWVKPVLEDGIIYLKINASVPPGVYGFKLRIRRGKNVFTIPLMVEVYDEVSKPKLAYIHRFTTPSSYTSVAPGETHVIPLLIKDKDVVGVIVELMPASRSSLSIMAISVGNESLINAYLSGLPPRITGLVDGWLRPFPSLGKYVVYVPKTSDKIYVYITSEILTQELGTKVNITIYPVYIRTEEGVTTLYCEYPLGLLVVNDEPIKYSGGSLRLETPHEYLHIELRDIPTIKVSSYIYGKEVKLLETSGIIKVWLRKPSLTQFIEVFKFINNELRFGNRVTVDVYVKLFLELFKHSK